MACVQTDRAIRVDIGHTSEDLEHLLRHKDGFIIVVVIFGEIHELVNISCQQHLKKSLSGRIKGR